MYCADGVTKDNVLNFVFVAQATLAGFTAGNDWSP
jgi:hypothetical protein